MMWEPLELELQEIVIHWTWLLETPEPSLQPPACFICGNSWRHIGENRTAGEEQYRKLEVSL